MAVCGRTGLCAGALRTDLEAPAVIEVGNGAAACAYGMDVDHGDHDRIPANECIPRRSLGERAIRDNADVCTGAADIEGNHVFPLCQVSDPGTSKNTGGETGHHGIDG